jgi:hypothetical protein
MRKEATMLSYTTELKRIANEVLGSVASTTLMGRVYVTLEQSTDAKTGAEKVQKLVALFLGPDRAKELGDRFSRALA